MAKDFSIFGKPSGHDIDARPDKLVARDDFMQRVEKAIEELPEELKDILSEFAIEEKSITKISALHNLTEEEVTTMIKRAKRQVKRKVYKRKRK